MTGQILGLSTAKTESLGSPDDPSMAFINSHVLSHIVAECTRASDYGRDKLWSTGQPGALFKVNPSDLQAFLFDATRTSHVLVGLVGYAVSSTQMPQELGESFTSTDVEIRGARVSLEALEFCAKNRIVPDLALGIDLVRRLFIRVSELRAYLQRDPEELDEYVVLEVNSNQESSEDLRSYLKYSETWSDSVKWPASRLIILDVNPSTGSSGR
jgi:hypothetical protein